MFKKQDISKLEVLAIKDKGIKELYVCTKTLGIIVLKVNYQTKYFKNGQANLHTETSYHVIEVDKIDMGYIEPGPRSKHWFKTKREAKAYLKTLIKPRLISDLEIDDTN